MEKAGKENNLMRSVEFEVAVKHPGSHLVNNWRTEYERYV